MKYEIPLKVLFVCSGNTCRSPMAEYLAKEMYQERGLEAKLGSRGSSAYKESAFLGSEKAARDVVMELYPHSKIFTHQNRQLKMQDLIDYDLILTMEERQRDNILEDGAEFIPDLEKRVFTLKEYVNVEELDTDEAIEISDPLVGSGYASWNNQLYEQELEVYSKCRDEILECLNRILDGKVLTYAKIMKLRKQREEGKKKQKKLGFSTKKKKKKKDPTPSSSTSNKPYFPPMPVPFGEDDLYDDEALWV
jgi:protein-tyrosine-phosphatase